MVNFQENFDLITLPIAKTPLNLEATMPVGGTLFVNKTQDGLLTQAKLFRGIEQIPAAYYWYKGNTEITDTNGYIGSKTERLFVPSSQISKTGDVVRVEVADCSDYVNQLVNQKVDTDAQVVEWKGLFQSEGENLLIKSKLIPGYIHPDKGSVVQWSTFMYNPDYISIGDKKNIIFKHYKNNGVTVEKTGFCIAFYDQNKAYLSTNFSWGVAEGQEIIAAIPPEAKYFRYTVTDINFDSKYEFGNKATDWSPSKQDLQNLVTQKTTQYKSETKLPENYRPATKPSKTYEANFLLIKKFPEYEEEVLITQGGIDPSVSSVQAEMIIKTNDGLLQNPEKYFSVGWLKQTNGTFKYKGFKVNISMADIVALNAENKELDYELREDLTLKV